MGHLAIHKGINLTLNITLFVLFPFCFFFKGLLTSLATVQGFFSTHDQMKGMEMTKGSHCSHGAAQPQTGTWESNTHHPVQQLSANRSHLAREVGADGTRPLPTCAHSCNAQGPWQPCLLHPCPAQHTREAIGHPHSKAP